MARTPSTMVALGSAAPEFRLPTPDGRLVALQDFRQAPALLVMFICNHCPFVRHIRDGLAGFARDVQSRGVAIVAINSNDFATYADDHLEKMAEEIVAAGYVFPLSGR